MSKKPVVMISSTTRDLKDYRTMVMDGCHRIDTFPKMMESLPASPSDAIKASMAMVDESEIYIGVFAHRYGYVPDGHEISITEMEYNRAVERGIPILIFIIDDEVLVLPKDIDKGKAADQLEILKETLQKKQIVAFFKSPEDLRGLVIHSLGELKMGLEEGEETKEDQGKKWAKSLHYTSGIPSKPEAYVAHPYTLLQVKGLIGRKRELEILTDWITQKSNDHISIFNIIAIGGMGKSALTWHWFNQIAPQEKDWDGRIWWSFYETDATFDNFITKTLAYTSGKTIDEIKELTLIEKQDQLFQALNNHPYLVVLDGLERILVAYARQDAAFLDDDTALDEQTANYIAGISGLPESGAKSFIGKHRLRKTTDQRTGHFLRKLSQIRKSKILISTRLFPADLQTRVGRPYPNCFALFLPGLSDQDALELWRKYGAKGSRVVMIPVLKSFDKHPLLLQLLASEVAEFRDAPGDFDAWKKANPEFNVFGLPLIQVQSHVLTYALKGLSEAELRTLQVIAGFRMPASMTTLKALLLENDKDKLDSVFSSVGALDQALTTLEDKGLLGWDRNANRYDLHPIVRGVVWNNLDSQRQYEIHGSLKSHFEAMPAVEDYTQVESIEDLRSAIELYNSLIEMKLYDEANHTFQHKLNQATLYRLSANNLRVDLLERVFVDGIDQLPTLSSKAVQAWTLNALATGYELSGMPIKAIPLYERIKESLSTQISDEDLAIVFSNLSDTLWLNGKLFQAEFNAWQGLKLSREIKEYYPEISNLEVLGRILAYRGIYSQARIQLTLRIDLANTINDKTAEGIGKLYLSHALILNNEFDLARELANDAWVLAGINRLERDFIEAAFCQGLAALRLNNLYKAKDLLHSALRRVRAVQVVQNELQILIALAELYFRQNNLSKAREYLDDVWDYAEQGPFPIFHADALNVLAQIEINEGNKPAATKAATEAYQKSWCDGPPYAYHYGLENAKRLLKELNAPEPEMPPFDPSKFEPMPEVEIEPLAEDEDSIE